MFASERRQRIREVLSEHKSVDVVRLSTMFNISGVTIRKDLELLESQGFLTRTHGGAVLNEGQNISTGLPSRALINKDEELIATIVAHFIKENEFIFLGLGSLCTQIASKVANLPNVNIVTNNLTAATVLVNSGKSNVIIVNGTVGEYNGSIGVADAFYSGFLKNMYFDQVIVAADGISFRKGYAVDSSNLCLTYKEVFSNTDNVIVCAQGSKFSKNSFASLGELDIATKIVTTCALPDEYAQYYYDRKIPVYHSYDLDDI